MPVLTIKIPTALDLDYENLKSALVYLETPECRRSLPDIVRLAEIKEYTQRFRAHLIVRNQITCFNMINTPNSYLS